MPSSQTQEWLDKAAEDERVVELIKKAGGPWAQAAYHVQQAAEKLIKAALVETGIAPPRSHDLEHLLRLFPGTMPDAASMSAAARISPYAWISRYPGAPPVSEGDFLTAEGHLTAIRSWALSAIP